MEALKTTSPQIYRFIFTCYYKQVVIPHRQQRVEWPADPVQPDDEGETRPQPLVEDTRRIHSVQPGGGVVIE